MENKCIFLLSLAYFTHYAHGTFHSSVPGPLWTTRCNKGDKVLNDCNWCMCKNGIFMCNARDCDRVDKFGHFKETIDKILVGMEGHGVWRSPSTACEPGVHYFRNDVVCVCNEDGDWPNPVCRDVLRVLYPVQIVPTSKQCLPFKHYVFGCNVCWCPSTGVIDETLCTKNKCDSNDPVFKMNGTEVDVVEELNKNSSELEVYADCQMDKVYKLGCRKCFCIKNNRLICGPCLGDKDEPKMLEVVPVKPNQTVVL